MALFPLNELLENLGDGTKSLKVSTPDLLKKQDEIINLLRGNEDAYGIEWNTLTDTLTRIGKAQGLVQSDFDDIHPWNGMRRCNVADDGTINAYYGDPTYKEDGSNGQVMVEIPKFYYKSYRTATGYAWFVSPNKKEGFTVFPAFMRNSIEKEYIYLAAFEGTLYDVSAGAYVGDGVTYDYANDMLASVAGLQPISGHFSNLDIVESRQLAQNRGAGWEQQDILGVSAAQLLYVVEYADFNIQNTISSGITNLDSGDANHSQNTGHTSVLGNSSGEVVIYPLENGATGASETYAMSYRGIENLFGNIWKWVDGINIRNHVPYVADHGFASDVFTDPYKSLGITLPASNGYVSDIAFSSNFDYGFLPQETTGSSASYLADYHYQSTGDRVARLGGYWNDGSMAGAFFWYLYDSSAFSNRYFGARLLFIPQN